MQSETLTKTALITILHEKTGKSRSEVKEYTESLLSMVKESIKKEGSLLVSGFGKFDAYAKKERKGRNPKTEETIILAPRKVLVFRTGRKFKEELNTPASE